jgi:uncharacterized protein YdaU (DUF1376 family)
MYPTDWRSGCLGLSLEEEGLYMRVCMFQAETGRRVPLDDSQAARMLGGVNLNQYRKVLGQLVLKGKVKRHEDGYGNDRIEHETKKAQGAAGKRPAATEKYPDREADQDEGREDHAVPVTVTPPATRVAAPPATPPVKNDFVEQNQTLSIEPRLKKEKVTPLPPKGGGTNFWGSALNPRMHGVESGVVFEQGSIALVNGNRKFWAEQFDGDDGALDLALIEVSGRVRPNSGRPLKTQVDAILAGIARDRRDRTARYWEAVDRNRPAGRSQPNALDVLEKMSFSS